MWKKAEKQHDTTYLHHEYDCIAGCYLTWTGGISLTGNELNGTWDWKWNITDTMENITDFADWEGHSPAMAHESVAWVLLGSSGWKAVSAWSSGIDPYATRGTYHCVACESPTI